MNEIKQSPQRIVITGFMGAGKTTVARALAMQLNCLFVDLDQFITEREKRTVPAIINEDGLTRFRAIETRALGDVLKNGSARVIALGGGAWTIEGNRQLIAKHSGFTVWLDAPFELCWRRIACEGNSRPLARDREEAQQLFLKRRPVYELAALRVETDEAKSVAAVVAEILHALR